MKLSVESHEKFLYLTYGVLSEIYIQNPLRYVHYFKTLQIVKNVKQDWINSYGFRKTDRLFSNEKRIVWQYLLGNHFYAKKNWIIIHNLKTQNERHYLSSISHQSLHGILMHTYIHIFAHTLIRKCIRKKGHFLRVVWRYL